MAKLQGITEICKFTGRSESTILDWIYNRGFPAKKVKGEYSSDTEKIDQWRIDSKIPKAETPIKPTRQRQKKGRW